VGVRLLILAFLSMLLAACATATAGSNLRMYVGYADNLQTTVARSNPTGYPNPWQGAGNVNFKGGGAKFDSGAIRLENPTGGVVNIDRVTVDIGPKHYDLWGSNLKVPANGSLILAQTEPGAQNPPVATFDTSEPIGTANG